MLAERGEVSRCKAEAAEAMLSVWRAESGRGSRLDTKLRCRVWDAISGMSWDMAVEAEEMTSGERALVGEDSGGRRGESRTWELSSPRGPLGETIAWVCRERNIYNKDSESANVYRDRKPRKPTCRFSSPGSSTADAALGLLVEVERVILLLLLLLLLSTLLGL